MSTHHSALRRLMVVDAIDARELIARYCKLRPVSTPVRSYDGRNLRFDTTKLRGKCPWCPPYRPGYLTVGQHDWHASCCKRRGDVVDFIAMTENPSDPVSWLARRYGV